jgi:hypothetical protein
MSLLVEIFEALGGVALPLAILLLAVVITLLNLIFRVTRAHVSQYSFQLTGGWQTFFIKNFDSIPYDSPLLIDVHAEELEQVIVHGGPTCTRAPEQIASGAVRITFMEVPADASFVIRAKADGRPITLEIPLVSPLQSRSFHRPMVAATRTRNFMRYSLRYLVGAATMLGLFRFGLYWNPEDLWRADYALMGAAVMLSLFSFWLVAPIEGKSIIAGYVAWGDTGRSWSRPAPGESGELPHLPDDRGPDDRGPAATSLRT